MKNNKFLVLIAIFVLDAAALAGDYHYPPARIDCRTVNGISISFQQYATNNVNRKRYNGEVYQGPSGEASVYDYDEIVYVELPNNGLNFKGTPIDPNHPSFEMQLERPNNSYVGSIDLTYVGGTKKHWNFQSCEELEFSHSK